MRYLGRIFFLASIWVLLWGALSVANVLSGIAVASLLLVLYPDPRVEQPPHGRPRPVAFARLAAHIVTQLFVSNAVVFREIVTRGSDIQAGVVACQLRTRSERTITFLANVISLSPGTMPVEVTTDPAVIYIHVLHLRDPSDERRKVARLEKRAVRAFGTPDDIARLGTQPDLHRRRGAPR